MCQASSAATVAAQGRHIPEEEYNVPHPENYVMEMPQSGEHYRGRENMRAFQEAHPAVVVVSAGAPSAGQGGTLWVVEEVIDYGDGRGYSTWWSSASSRMGRCGETDGTSRSRS